MGANSSTTGESDLDRDKILRREGPQLSVDEGQALKKLFVAIAGGPGRRVYEESNLQAYFQNSKTRLPPPSVTGLFNALIGEDKDKYTQYTQNDHPQQSFTFFIRHSSHLLIGSLQDKAERLYVFCSRGQAVLNKSTLKASLVDVIQIVSESGFAREAYPHLADFPNSPERNEQLASYLLGTLSSNESSDTEELSQGSFEDWLSKSELSQRIFQLAFTCIFYQETPPSSTILAELRENVKTNHHLLPVPLKITHPLIRETFPSKLLDHSSLMLLSNFFPTEIRGKLYPLFSSFHHGESFSMFCKQLVASQGPTLIVAKDTNGFVFGAFATEKWQFGPKFKGNANCFLFTLAPSMGVYLPSGYNENYMYLEQNAQTLPNGLGMGGQMEYFGLWLSADYGHGHSKAKPKCSTYNSPRLSKEEEFQLQLLEVWGVGDPVLPEEIDSGPSILDKDKTANALLEMAGKKLYSKDIREAPDES